MVICASQSRESSNETVAERRFALGLGLTNECNLACSFCYRDPTRLDRLSLEQVQAVMKSLPVRSVNLGTGENGMHPDFAELVNYLRSEPIKLTITSNGYSIAALDDAEVTAFHDIEFSLDYPTEAEQDQQRGPGNWRLIHKQAARCRGLGISVTFIAVMMRSNFDRLAEIAEIVRPYDAPLRQLHTEEECDGEPQHAVALATEVARPPSSDERLAEQGRTSWQAWGSSASATWA
jgi:MoaA/NifB/PqqE/SkfB family radical SAM enzyme